MILLPKTYRALLRDLRPLLVVAAEHRAIRVGAERGADLWALSMSE